MIIQFQIKHGTSKNNPLVDNSWLPNALGVNETQHPVNVEKEYQLTGKNITLKCNGDQCMLLIGDRWIALTENTSITLENHQLQVNLVHESDNKFATVTDAISKEYVETRENLSDLIWPLGDYQQSPDMDHPEMLITKTEATGSLAFLYTNYRSPKIEDIEDDNRHKTALESTKKRD